MDGLGKEIFLGLFILNYCYVIYVNQRDRVEFF